MSGFRTISFAMFSFVMSAALICPAQTTKSDKSVNVVFKDGHQKRISIADGSRIEFKNGNMVVNDGGKQQTIAVADVDRLDFNSSTASKGTPFGRNHFLGKWEFGEGNGQNFSVTLDPDGSAHKSIGAPHGTWTVVDGEARISWDDGWKDVIRKVGSRHEKFAYEPGKSISDEPSNVAAAKSLNSEPL
jgi:hypothetical protein